MMNCPARRPSPSAAVTSATWRTVSRILPVPDSRSAGTGGVLAVADQLGGKSVELRAGAGGVLRPENDMALPDVAREQALDVVHRAVEVGQFDGGPERADRCAHRGVVGVGGRSRAM